jgi:hypothetical protein
MGEIFKNKKIKKNQQRWFMLGNSLRSGTFPKKVPLALPPTPPQEVGALKLGTPGGALPSTKKNISAGDLLNFKISKGRDESQLLASVCCTGELNFRQIST